MLKLISNGVQISNFIHCRSLLLYSTATNSLQEPLNPLMEYLVKSVGFSPEAAVAAAEKLSHLKSPEKPIAVINFLKQSGFEQSHIKSILTHQGRLLSCRNVDKTLSPKFRVLKDLGFSDSELGSLIAANSSVLRRSAGTHLKPLIECLRSVLGSDEVVIKAIRRNYMLLDCALPRLKSNLSLLESYCISGERLVSLALYNPWPLICPTEVLEKNLKDVETVFGIPRKNSMFLHGMFTLSSISRETMESKFGVFRSYGWSEEDIKKLVRSFPGCLRLSESKIKVGLDYYMKELNYEADFIASYPSLLNFSMKNRVMPRRALWKALIKKDLITTKISFCTFVYMSEQRFLNYITPFKSQLPKLLDSCMIKSLSSSLAAAK